MAEIKKIYKYDLLVNDRVSVEMPAAAEILAIQVQHNEPRIWAMVNPDAPKVIRKFRVYGTGHSVPAADELVFLGTFQLHGGSLVFHVFEELG